MLVPRLWLAYGGVSPLVLLTATISRTMVTFSNSLGAIIRGAPKSIGCVMSAMVVSFVWYVALFDKEELSCIPPWFALVLLLLYYQNKCISLWFALVLYYQT